MKTNFNLSNRLPILAATLVSLLQAIAAAAQTAFVVYPEFQNVLTNSQNNPATANSLALFSGYWDEANPPAGGTNRLIGCGFGQMFARDVPYPDFVPTTVAEAAALLYPPANATSVDEVKATGTAFRYKKLLYQMTGDGKVRAQFETITNLFTDVERGLVTNAIGKMRHGLKYAPLDRGLRHALLDAYYDWMVAETQLVKSDMAEVAKYRLELIFVQSDEFIIDKEIEGYSRILTNYQGVLEEYGNLFSEQSGIDVSQIDPTATPGMTLGTYIFQREQPYRNQLAPSYCSADGSSVTNLLSMTNQTVFQGYKDYVALLGVLRDYGQSAADLARFLGMRSRGPQDGQPDDRTRAFKLIQDVSQEAMLNCSFLNALLPNGQPTNSASDTAGVLAALGGVQNAMAELDKAGGFLSGDKNVLGFDPDFLVLMQTFVTSDQQHLWDSYDALCGWLDPTRPSSVLHHAEQAFIAANASYNSYRGYQDQLATQLSDNDDTYRQRYREITGYWPDDPADPWPTPVPANRYPPVNTNLPPSHATNPRPNSELRQAYQSIEQSNQKQAELKDYGSLLKDQAAETYSRMSAGSNALDAISDATKKYKNVIGRERDTITTWNAAQAGAQAYYDMISDAAGLSGSINPAAVVGMGAIGVVGWANVAVQTTGEAMKGNAEKQLDLASADFERDVELAETSELVHSAAEEVRSVERETASLGLTMTDNSFLRNQDLERVDGLVREMEQANAFRMANNSALGERYFADPIHFLRAQNDLVRADLFFREAQRWVFITGRALEYKYNKPFIYTFGGTTWQLASLFKLRSYRELADLLAAMDAYNVANLPTINGRVAVTDTISVKNDVWADALSLTNAAARLARFRQEFANCLNPETGQYEIKLNLHALAAELTTGNLFRGPRYGPSGTLTSPGYYIDKIEWIKIKLLDSTVSPDFDVPDCSLHYGGTCYIRSFCAPSQDPGIEWPAQLRAFPFRYYVTYTDTNGVMRAHSSPEQWANVRVKCTNLPGEPTMEPNDFWQERSVAATAWTLTIPDTVLINPNTLDDIQIYVRHRFAPSQPCQ